MGLSKYKIDNIRHIGESSIIRIYQIENNEFLGEYYSSSNPIYLRTSVDSISNQSLHKIGRENDKLYIDLEQECVTTDIVHKDELGEREILLHHIVIEYKDFTELPKIDIGSYFKDFKISSDSIFGDVEKQKMPEEEYHKLMNSFLKSNNQENHYDYDEEDYQNCIVFDPTFDEEDIIKSFEENKTKYERPIDFDDIP